MLEFTGVSLLNNVITPDGCMAGWMDGRTDKNPVGPRRQSEEQIAVQYITFRKFGKN